MSGVPLQEGHRWRRTVITIPIRAVTDFGSEVLPNISEQDVTVDPVVRMAHITE